MVLGPRGGWAEGWLLLAGFQATAESWGDRSTELGTLNAQLR